MKTYAKIENDIVVNVSVADDNWNPVDWIDCTNQSVGIGYTYLPLENIFMPPKCHAEAVLNAAAAKWKCTNEDHNVKSLAE